MRIRDPVSTNSKASVVTKTIDELVPLGFLEQDFDFSFDFNFDLDLGPSVKCCFVLSTLSFLLSGSIRIHVVNMLFEIV